MPKTHLLESQINRLILFLTIPITLIIAFILIKIHPIYAIAAAIGGGVLIFTFINTDFAIYILIFSMLLSPEFGSRTTTGEGITIRIDDLILSVIIFTWLAKTAIYKELGIFRKTPLNKPIAYYLTACFISTALGALAGRVKPATGMFFILKYIEYFMVYFMVANQVNSRKQIERFITSLLITFLLVIIIAMMQIPTGQRLTAPFEGEEGEPNTLGGYIVLIMSLNMSLILNPEVFPRPKLRRAVSAVTLLSIIPLALTNSRGSWVATIPVIIGYIIISKRRHIILAFIVSFIFVAPYILPESVIERVKYTFQEQRGYARTLQEELPGGVVLDPSASERLRSWKLAFRDIKKHPVFGYGIAGWRFLDAQFIRVMIETGFVGLATFIYLLYTILKQTKKIERESKIPFLKAISQGFYIGTIAMIFHSIGANTFIIVRIMEPYWLLCGIVQSIPIIEKEEEKQLRKIEKEFKSVKLGV